MATELNRFLTTLDASFLYFERPKEPLHIGSCMIYEGRIDGEELKQLLSDRLHLVPRYRQRVVFPPFGVSHPVWVDDPNFDLDNHVEVIEMDGPVGPKELGAYVAQAHSGMLDRRRPLWSVTILSGLPRDHTAIVWKVHHAMVDGVSGVDLMMVLNDFVADPESTAQRPGDWEPAALPDPLTLLQESIQHRLSEVAKNITDNAFDAMRPEKVFERVRKLSEAGAASLPSMMRPAPRTPFNRQVGGNLGYAWAEFSFTELRQVKTALGGTVNDLALAILSGGLGRYLKALGEDTKGVELRAMCPVSLRGANEHGQLGNQVSTIVAPLFIGIEDPIERLEAEKKAMNGLKEAGQAEAFYEMSRLGSQIPPSWQSLAGLVPPAPQALFNTVSTNVPGPQIPLYQNGRRLLTWLPLGVVSNNIGLFVAILTYDHKITLGLTVDSDLIPDVWQISAALEEAYHELRRAADVVAEEVEDSLFAASPSKAVPKRRRRKPASPAPKRATARG